MSTPSEPLILTPDEFAKLTARGVLKFHPPPQQDIKPQMTSMSRVVATPQPAPVINTNNDMDVSPVLRGSDVNLDLPTFFFKLVVNYKTFLN